MGNEKVTHNLIVVMDKVDFDQKKRTEKYIDSAINLGRRLSGKGERTEMLFLSCLQNKPQITLDSTNTAISFAHILYLPYGLDYKHTGALESKAKTGVKGHKGLEIKRYSIDGYIKNITN